METAFAHTDEWKSANIQVFWGEIAPCEHSVQFYENDGIFLNTLEGFVGSGIIAHESIIVLATKSHIEALNERLQRQGFDLNKLRDEDSYLAIEVEEVFSQILINGWLDEARFNNYVVNLLNRAGKGGRKVRAFGELVAVLWEQGHCGVTVQLENLWHKLYHKLQFNLYCAYPKIGFTNSPGDSMDMLCKSHSQIIDGQARPSTEIYYKSAVA